MLAIFFSPYIFDDSLCRLVSSVAYDIHVSAESLAIYAPARDEATNSYEHEASTKSDYWSKQRDAPLEMKSVDASFEMRMLMERKVGLEKRAVASQCMDFYFVDRQG